MPIEGNPIFEASQRVQGYLDAYAKSNSLDPELIHMVNFDETGPQALTVSDLKLLVAVAVFATKGQA